MVFIFIGSIVAIIFLRPRRSRGHTTLGTMRHALENIEQGIEDLKEQLWHYGSDQEESVKRWKTACLATAQKSVSLLQSCWYERDTNAWAMETYDELLQGLKTIGIEEIIPVPGELIDENDRTYRIVKQSGHPPFKVSAILCPGYCFRTDLARVSNIKDRLILEPAIIEIVGEDHDKHSSSI